METNFIRLYFNMFYKPKSTFKKIFESENSIKFGFYAILVPAIGYTLFYIMAYHSGGSPSTFKPWLALPIEDYFKFDIFLSIPGYFVSWAVSSTTIYLLMRLFSSKVKFDNVAAVIGFGIGVATWSSLFHDLCDASLSILGVIKMSEYEILLNQPTFWRGLLLTLYTIYFFWFLTIFTIGIQQLKNMNLLKAIGIAFAGLAVFQVILLIFIR